MKKVFLLMKMIEKWLKKTPAIIWHIKHWCPILFLINKQGLKSCKDRNRDRLFTNLIDYCRYKSSDINVCYVKWRLESSSIIFLSVSLANKASKAQKTEIVTVCLQIWLISQPSVIRYQCLMCQKKAGVFFNNFSIIFIYNNTFFSNKRSL